MIFKIYWPEKITIINLRKRAEMDKTSELVKVIRWTWIGHIFRKDANSNCIIALKWTPKEEGNKKPEGQHIVHLGTMNHLFNGSAKTAILDYWSARKTTNLVADVEILLPVNFIEFRSGVSEKTKMSQQIRGRVGRLLFPIGPKNTNLVKDIEILLPVKFRWIPFCGFRGEVENVSANQRPGQSSCFSDRPKNTNSVKDVEILFPVKFRWIPFSSFRGEVENVSTNQRPGGHLVFPIGPKNTNLVKDVEILLSVKFRWIPFCGFRGEDENVSANQRPGRPSCFSGRPKNTNLLEDVEILFPLKFRWIPFSSFRGKVENVSANQRLWRPSCFSDWPEKHKLCRGCWDPASCPVSLNSVQRVQRSRKCEKITTDGRRTMRDHNSALEPSAQVH